MVCWKILFSSSRFSLAFLSVDRSHLVKRLLEDRLRRALVRDGLLEDFVLLLTVLARLLKLNLRLRDLLFERLLLLSLRLISEVRSLISTSTSSLCSVFSAVCLSLVLKSVTQ